MNNSDTQYTIFGIFVMDLISEFEGVFFEVSLMDVISGNCFFGLCFQILKTARLFDNLIKVGE